MTNVKFCSWFGSRSGSDIKTSLLTYKFQRSFTDRGAFPTERDLETFNSKRRMESLVNEGAGLWTRPSLFNHSCHPSCDYGVIGDFLFVVANRDIHEGSVMSISYLDNTLSFSERDRKLRGWNGGKGFACDCARCAVMRSDTHASRMEEEIMKIHQEAGAYVNTNHVSYKDAMNKFVSSVKEKEYLAKFDGLDIRQQTLILPILEMQAMISMEKGKGVKALGMFQKIVEIEEAAFGSSFSAIRTVRGQIRLAYALLFAGKEPAAREILKKLYTGCCLSHLVFRIHPLTK